MEGKVNPDLQKERNSASFSPEELTYVLDGGKYITDRRREVTQHALDDEAYTKSPDYNTLSREEKYSDSLRRVKHFVEKSKELGLDQTPGDSYWYGNIAFPNEAMPLGLHSAMFLPTLNSQASDEQKARWLPECAALRMIGTYAQTELGHGTHVRGLETTATYDPRREEFVIHCPTLTAMKWWPGGLGKTTNHVLCMAKLWTQGRDHGTHLFLVQTRSMQTHQPMPGISIGDIGNKFGYDTMDNGFLKFDHVRIPRTNMLMKNSQVLKDGTYVANPKSGKLSYGTMVFVRAMIVWDVGARALAQASTIAVRYSCVRRQSEMKPGAPEPQILDYQTQQHKLLPLIAASYAYWFAGLDMRNTYFKVNYEIQQGNTELLPELHAVSSGLKAFTTWGMLYGVEQCRLACGGHGYSHASGLPKIYVTNTPGCTYEGENTVMMLQTARYLMKAFGDASSGKQLSGSVSYLSERTAGRCNLGRDFSTDTLIAAYKHRASRLVKKAGLKIQKHLASGKPQWEAWNLSSVDLVKASTVHIHFFVVLKFVEAVENADCGTAVRDVLLQLVQLYAVHGIVENSGDFVEDGYCSAVQLDQCNEKMLSLYAAIRPNAVSLVDSFDFPDHMLQSILGRYDGNVYENMYKWALKSRLNQTEVHESYHKYLRPLMQESSSKL